jgi:hypothetical protein
MAAPLKCQSLEQWHPGQLQGKKMSACRLPKHRGEKMISAMSPHRSRRNQTGKRPTTQKGDITQWVLRVVTGGDESKLAVDEWMKCPCQKPDHKGEKMTLFLDELQESPLAAMKSINDCRNWDQHGYKRHTMGKPHHGSEGVTMAAPLKCQSLEQRHPRLLSWREIECMLSTAMSQSGNTQSRTRES